MVVHLAGWVTAAGGRHEFQAIVVAAAWFAVVAALVLWRSQTPPAARPRPWSVPAVWYTFVGVSTAGSAVAALHSLRQLPQTTEELVHQLAFAPVLGIVLGLWLVREVRRGTVPARRTVLVWSLVTVDAVVAFCLPIFLSKETPAAVGVVAVLYGLAFTGLMRSRAYLVIPAVLAVLLIAMPVRHFLRIALYDSHMYERPLLAGHPGETPAAGPSVRHIKATAQQERIKAREFNPAADGLRLPRLDGVAGLLEFELAGAMDRLNRLSDLAYVVEMTPRHIPYLDGETYQPILGIVVPRAVWPNKPVDASGTIYAARYGLLPPDAVRSQNYDVPIITEAWMNGGWWSVLGSAAVFGLLLRLISRCWIGNGETLGNAAIGMAVVAAAVDIESSLALTLGGVIHALFVFGCLDLLVRAVDRRTVAAWKWDAITASGN
jgi:hypothetical protein